MPPKHTVVPIYMFLFPILNKPERSHYENGSVRQSPIIGKCSNENKWVIRYHIETPLPKYSTSKILNFVANIIKIHFFNLYVLGTARRRLFRIAHVKVDFFGVHKMWVS